MSEGRGFSVGSDWWLERVYSRGKRQRHDEGSIGGGVDGEVGVAGGGEHTVGEAAGVEERGSGQGVASGMEERGSDEKVAVLRNVDNGGDGEGRSGVVVGEEASIKGSESKAMAMEVVFGDVAVRVDEIIGEGVVVEGKVTEKGDNYGCRDGRENRRGCWWRWG